MSATVTGGAGLVERASEAFARAAEVEPVTERVIAPGGVPVRIRIAGATLVERLLPALPRTDRAAQPVLTFEAWDGACGVGLPPSPWGASDVLPGEEVRGATSGEVIAAMAPDHGTVSVLDRRSGRGIFWTRDGRAMPDWEDGSPLRHLLRWGLADHGLALLHAAGVGVPGGRGALLLGNGGAGKSTTALACLEHGLDVVADDYCLVDARALAPGGAGDADTSDVASHRPGVARAHRLYSIGKLGARSLELLPGLASIAGPLRGPQHKSHLDLAGRYASTTPVDALILPRVADRTGPATEIPASLAVRRVIASTLLQMPARRDATISALFGLARTLPAYELPVGPDVRSVADAVREVLEA